MGVLIALVVLGAFFGILERRSVFRWERRVDFIYWFFTPFVSRPITAIFTAVVILMLGKPGSTWFASQPLTLQWMEVLVGGDITAYWIHRLFHRQPLWRFHAIHHSSESLDWLAASRVHPLNEAIGRVLQLIPFFVLGFDPRVIAAAVPFLTFYAIFLHANLSWDFGPLRFVIASPRFHRWHHTSEAEGLDKNFAGLFPWIDLLFGTFHMPAGRGPQTFGLTNETVPTTFVAQLAYPFRPSARRVSG
jgi:sterol desaturase/sphingolipid hydroxylase (fatty acid hydroxylase superfamily)